MSAPATRRCFVALDLPGELTTAAVASQRELESVAPGLRFTRPENIHLTLKFLGSISAETEARARERLAGLGSGPLPVRLGAAGCFAPRIVWLELRGADALQARVDGALTGLFEPERRFMGHITIARARASSKELRAQIEALAVPEFVVTARSLSLVASELRPSGPRYALIERFAL